jgi:tetratricopeptide (TPR) repeat protein/tRNA A-37 threonylcarbamoyl transferase component Bud32
MSNSLVADNSWAASMARRVDQICDRFEAAWKTAAEASRRPQLEDFLADTPEPERPVLLEELLELELIYRRRAGDTLTLDEYACRFPEHALLLSALFARVGPAGTPPPAELDPYATQLPGPQPGGAAGTQPSFHGGSGRLPPPSAGDIRPASARGPRRRMAGYEILEELGRGGMGVVYKARQPGLKRFVALKMIRDGALAGPEQRARFQTEAEAIARLRHPNIVQVYEIGEYKGRPYFSLEFIEGGSLDKQLAHTPQPAAPAARLVTTLAQAIHHAHQQGIIHRDLKPANILLSAEQKVLSAESKAAALSTQHSALSTRVPKIADFGLAKQLHQEGQTHSGAVLGTLSYMAPEQATGRTDIGPTADVYSLGAILYEMLTGQPPFRGASWLDLLELVKTADPVPPSRLQPKVPRDLETICLKCLQKEPVKRYATAEALADDLRRFTAGEPIRARPVGLLERGVKWARRHPARAWSCALASLLAVVLVGGGAGVLFIQQQLQVREALQQLRERERIDDARAEVQQTFTAGQTLALAGDWQNARVQFEKARQAIDLEPSLADDFRAPVAEGLAATERRLQEEAEQKRANDLYTRFEKKRNEALFHEWQFTGGDKLTNLEKVRTAAQTALALVGVRLESQGGPDLSPALSPEQRAAITTGCYELLLLWAEATAPALPDPTQAVGQDQTREALAILDRAASLGQSKAFHQRRARYLDQLGDRAAALQERGRAQAMQPHGAVDYFLTALDAFNRGDIDAAVRDCDMVLRLQPDHFWAEYLLANCSLQSGKWDAAKGSLTHCLSRYPGFVWLYALRAFARGEGGDFAAAESDFQRAFALLDQQAPDDLTRYGLYVNRGYLYLRQHKYDLAAADSRQAIAVKPDQWQGYVHLAQALEGQEKVKEAIVQLDTAVRRAPRLAALYRLRARLHRKNQDPPAALADLDRAIALQPAGRASRLVADDQVERGQILQADKPEEALRAYAAALALQPKHATALRLQTKVLLDLHRYQEAARSLDSYVRVAQPTAEVFRVRGWVRARLNNFAGAVEDFTRALELEPEHAETLAYRGWAHLTPVIESPRQALADFEGVLRLAPDNAEAHAGRGNARAQLGQVRPAVADAEKALRQGPRKPRLLYNTARIYAQVAGKLEDDPRNRQAPERRSIVTYQERAVELLREALTLAGKERGSLWRDITTDPAFQPLRRSASYLPLAKEYAPPAAGQGQGKPPEATDRLP